MTGQALKPRSVEKAEAHAPGAGFVQVAFAGHNRPEDLGDPRAVTRGLRHVFALLSQAGAVEARLLTGLAAGADHLAVAAWQAVGLGPVHAVFPFLDEQPSAAEFALVQSGTWLDGAATEAVGRNPHLAQTRWLMGAADLLVVAWTGEVARGAGGTADAVRLALEHGLPVLWVDPADASSVRLIRPDYLDDDFGFLEFLEQLRLSREALVTPATVHSVHALLHELGLLGRPDDEPIRAAHSDSRIAWPWRTYALFRRTLGGRAPPFEAAPAPADLSSQPGFAALTAAHNEADRHASVLSSIHRSQQVLLLAAAIIGAAVGSASAMWPQLKLTTVVVELLLALAALVVWLNSDREGRHERWGRARRLAEHLRLERVAWALGVSTTAPGLISGDYGHAARAIRRRAGLPEGRFDAPRVARWGAWAMDELIAGQAAYHHAQSAINGRIAHRMHQFENASFAVLMIVLLSYVVASFAMPMLRLDEPPWLTGAVVMAGAIVPAIGAAGLAVEATLSLGEQALRSRVLAARLDAIAAEIGPSPGLEALQSAAKAAMRLHVAQEDHWSEGAVRRKLYRGG